jgi:hypothetical protein
MRYPGKGANQFPLVEINAIKLEQAQVFVETFLESCPVEISKRWPFSIGENGTAHTSHLLILKGYRLICPPLFEVPQS